MRVKNRMNGASNSLVNLAIILLALLLAKAAIAAAQKKYDTTGMVLKVDKVNQTLLVSCREIPGHMEAMAMPLSVRDPKALEGLAPGMTIEFSLIVDKDSSYAEDVHVRPFESLELDPSEARRMKLMENAMASKSGATDILHVGQPVPDFALTDQSGKRVSLTQLKNRVVAVTFIYTRCPLPNYCVRLANNLGVLQRRFKDRMGSDLVLLTIIIDPVHD